MTAKPFLTDQQKIRFICCNHMIYDNSEKLAQIMDNFEIHPNRFDITNQNWWESVSWWKDEAFLDALDKVEVELNKEIEIKINRTDSKKYYVSSKK